MDQRDSHQNILIDDEVERLRQEIKEIRVRLASNVVDLKSRVSMRSLVEKTVETAAGHAGSLVGQSLSAFRRLFPKRSA